MNTNLDNIPIIIELKFRDIKRYDDIIKMYDWVKEQYYPFSRDENPWFNDHGELHTIAIIEILSSMLSKYFVMSDAETIRQDLNFALSTGDIFVLLSAVIWHDALMVQGRNHHGVNVINATSEINKFVNDIDITSCIIKVAMGHSDKHHFHTSKNVVLINGEAYQQKMLTAFLRFVDEISEDKERGLIGKLAEPKIIGTDHEVYWKHTQSINSSLYNAKDDSIDIVYKVDSKEALSEFRTDDASITLIEFIINRIKKLNDERILCTPYFAQYCQINKINVTIEFYYTDENGYREYIYTIDKTNVSSYPDNNSNIEHFITAYPKYSITEITRILKENILHIVQNS